MPAVGPLHVEPGDERDPDAGYRSRFRHATEIAKPGYYAVTLDESDNIYIQSATLNGEPLDRSWFPAKQLLNGGTLSLQMGPEPNKEWGAGMEKAPPAAK